MSSQTRTSECTTLGTESEGEADVVISVRTGVDGRSPYSGPDLAEEEHPRRRGDRHYRVRRTARKRRPPDPHGHLQDGGNRPGCKPGAKLMNMMKRG